MLRALASVAVTLLLVACTTVEAPPPAEPVLAEDPEPARRSPRAWRQRPIEGAADVAPWEQVEEVCLARNKDRGTTWYRYTPEDTIRRKETGMSIALEKWLSEWGGCLAEYGWQLVPIYAPEDDPIVPIYEPEDDP